MYFVGLDLAWGENQPTGIAVLDDGGHLLEASARRDDAAIVASLGPYVGADCVVGIDAPLVVHNTTGNRPCEAALNRDYARFDAGAHPSNTGKPEFANGPRGARLAAALGLDLDPRSTSRRRAIEVYPHPATVALFHLGRTLKYKNRSGRPLALLRSELLRLIELIEGLKDSELPLYVEESTDWQHLVAQVESAQRKSDLRRAEDPIDAALCAYIAMHAERLPDQTTLYGDLATGYIVTPSLPDGHEPSRRTPKATEPATVDRDPVREAIRAYAALQPEVRDATQRYEALVTTLLDDAGINYLSVTGRAKTVASFAAKADRNLDGEAVYSDPLEQITDQIGVRVITYLRSDVTTVAELLGDQLTVLDDRDMGQETAREGRFGYASRHLLVTMDEDRATSPFEALRGRRAQVQVRTVLQHAWAEFEHAIRYKGTIPEEHVPDLDRRFTLAAGLLELADREFTLIRDRLQATETPAETGRTGGTGGTGGTEEVGDPRISSQELAKFLASQYAEAGWSRTDHYTWVSGLLLELGITSLEELGTLLASVDSAAINARMGYRYPPGAVRRLDDALLAIFGSRYLALHGNAHRVGLLGTRLDKLSLPGAPTAR